MEENLATDSRGPCRARASRRLSLLGAVAAFAVAASAQAADVGVIGNQLQLKDGSKKKITAKSKDVAIVAPTGDPTVSGATLDVFLVNTAGTQTESFTLPAAGWKASGSPVKQYKYKGEKGTPIKSVTLSFGKQIKATGTPLTLSLSGAPSITAKLVLSIGSTDRYCIDFTTPPNPNTIQQAKWKEQTTAGVCPGAPTTTTTTEPPTTTTTTLPDTTCGNGVQGPGEACDDNNLVDCDGCDSNCTLSETCGNGIVCDPEQCDGGPGCNGSCETTGTTCGAASGQRLVIVSIDTPEPLAGVQVVLDYPQFQTSLPGAGNSSEVRSRMFLFPSQGVNIVNDNDTELNTVFANATNFITSGPLFAANFDECTPLSSNICARNPTVIDCCNNPADPGQFGNLCARYSPALSCNADVDCPGPDNTTCTAAGVPYPCCIEAGTGTCTPSSFCTGNGAPLGCCSGAGVGTCTGPNGGCVLKCPANPPSCAPGTFPTDIPDGPCTAPAGGCPGENACITQTSVTGCAVSSPTKFEGGQAIPVDGVTCTVTIL
jgi:cysteine-rich repeat protein